MIDIKQLVEDQSISACCYGRFFKDDDAEYALESKVCVYRNDDYLIELFKII